MKQLSISPLTLFLRLIVVINRVLESEIEDYFSCELLPYTMSLFEDGAMRTATKAKLKNFLLKDVFPAESLPITFRTTVDESAFLWCCKWKIKDLFGDIFQKYVDTVGKFGIDVVVFDGYAVSTKDCTHQKRTEKSQILLIFVMIILAQQNENFSLLTSVIKRNLFQGRLES